MATLSKTPELIKEPIRALWWKQPYGTLMLHGKVETRVWHSRYKGLVLICTSKEPYSVDTVSAISGKHCLRIHDILQKESKPRFDYDKPFSNIPLGQAIAVGRLSHSWPMVEGEEEACFVKHGIGLFSHVYTDVTAIKPFPLKGQQGWKKLESGIWDKIEFLK